MVLEEQEVCPGCDGKKVQTNKDGIKILCPVCSGTGKFYSNWKWWKTITETSPSYPYPIQVWYSCKQV